MSAIDYTFVVDLARPYKANTLMVMQHDANSRVVHFLLMNDGKRYDMEGVSGVILTAVTPSETTIVSDLEIVQDEDGNNTNEVVYTIPSDITMTAGRTTMVITLYADNLQLSSFEFYVNTRNELYNVGAYDDTDDMTGFRDLLARCLTAVSRIEAMTANETLPNPYPLRLILDEDEIYSYNGAETVEVSFDGILDRIAAIEESFPAGCNLIYNAAVAAGVTPTDRSPQALAAAYAVFKQGNATRAQVMSGKTFTSSAGVNVSGSMATLTSSNFSGSHGSATAGATSNYTVKSTSAGYVANNTTVHTAAAGTSPTISTTSATGTQVINVKPGIYNKVSVNQTNAYEAGVSAGKAADMGARETIRYVSRDEDGPNTTVTVTLSKNYRVVAAGAAHEGTGQGSDVTYSGSGLVTYCAGMYTWEKNITIVNARKGDTITLTGIWYAVYGWV
jgi:hypothetical protein